MLQIALKKLAEGIVSTIEELRQMRRSVVAEQKREDEGNWNGVLSQVRMEEVWIPKGRLTSGGWFVGDSEVAGGEMRVSFMER
ncbi:hypothetical protein RYX36_005392 [Vicia faba]